MTDITRKTIFIEIYFSQFYTIYIMKTEFLEIYNTITYIDKMHT